MAIYTVLVIYFVPLFYGFLLFDFSTLCWTRDCLDGFEIELEGVVYFIVIVDVIKRLILIGR
jgi:hypothetical protein